MPDVMTSFNNLGRAYGQFAPKTFWHWCQSVHRLQQHA